jgi:glucose/arabinose dehydrogenase
MGWAAVVALGVWQGNADDGAPQLALQRVGTGFARPVFVTTPPGETGRLFVVEQHSGRIRILRLADGSIEPEPFLTVPGVTQGGEQGLLGLAFHPDYATNGFFFVNYTTTGGGPAGHSEVVRYQAQGDPPTSIAADPLSKKVLLTYAQPEANHNGGWVGFGTDGFLYISTGDGGGGNDQHGTIGNGQDRGSLLGKILRIDPDQGDPYAIPTGNPFAGVAGQREEIWAFGLRNPWRCSVDRSTGDLWIGDVGQGAREEIDLAPAGVAGLNFGWRPREGLIQTPAFPNENPVTPATDPVHDYGRSLGFSVTGGYVYRGQAIPELQGAYFFGDFGSGRIWTLRREESQAADVVERTEELNSGSPKPVGGLPSFGEDGAGELFVCDLNDGEIYRIVSAQSGSITLSETVVNAGVFTFQFDAVPGEQYAVEARESIATGDWQTVTNIAALASAGSVTVSDALSGSQRFYRVRVP